MKGKNHHGANCPSGTPCQREDPAQETLRSNLIENAIPYEK